MKSIPDELGRLLPEIWEQCAQSKDYVKLLDAHIAGYQLIRATEGAERAVEAALISLGIAIDTLLEASGKQSRVKEIFTPTQMSCSFCSCSNEIVRLAAGPSVWICENCVKSLHEHFIQQDLQPPTI